PNASHRIHVSTAGLMPAVTLGRSILAEVQRALFPRHSLLGLNAAAFHRVNPIGTHLKSCDVVARCGKMKQGQLN
ncbi:MAG TPA: hypothetical protein VIM06_12300, partial [Rhodanobacter sp.]